MRRLFLLSFAFMLSNGDLKAMDKSIQGSYQGGEAHMVGDGFRVHNYFPSANQIETSPFVLLDYMAPAKFTPSPDYKRGVGAHPHRGFETVTFVYEGAIAHRDSTGSGGVIRSGDIQWMTAGSGVLHEEFHDKDFAATGGILHGVQLWVNLPAKDKMTAPRYQTLTDQNIPRKSLDANGSFLRVIAGNYDGLKSPSTTHSPLVVYDADLKKDASLKLTLPKDDNTFLLIMKGSILINDKDKASFKDLIAFNHDGDTINLKASEDALFLVLSGKPLNEPVVFGGPFVMNTQNEIDQAFKDFRSGKFGSMP